MPDPPIRLEPYDRRRMINRDALMFWLGAFVGALVEAVVWIVYRGITG